MDIKAQPGKQEMFLECKADIVIYGGAAGGGKSFSLLLEPLHHVLRVKDFGAVIFRRTYPQVTGEGGLWDNSMKIYPHLNAIPKSSSYEWYFAETNNTIKFAHLEYEKNVLDWQGSQIPLLEFDELCHFTANQFWYLLSRNRSTCGVKPYVRATCNPDADSWVRKLIDWWIGSDGYPIESRCGKIRYFVKYNENLIWADTYKECYDKTLNEYGLEPEDILPKSFTFISANLNDNQILVKSDPNYKSNLLAQSQIERERLLKGNWDIKASAGNVFKKEWFEIVDEVPDGGTTKRYWDRAATLQKDSNDPDFTSGVKGVKIENTIFVTDVCHFRDTPLQRDEKMSNIALQDGLECKQIQELDPGQAGKTEREYLSKFFKEKKINFKFTEVPKANKETRANLASAKAEQGLIKLKRAYWNDEFLNELANFPEGNHDDMVDGLSGLVNEFKVNSTASFNMNALQSLLNK